MSEADVVKFILVKARKSKEKIGESIRLFEGFLITKLNLVVFDEGPRLYTNYTLRLPLKINTGNPIIRIENSHTKLVFTPIVDRIDPADVPGSGNGGVLHRRRRHRPPDVPGGGLSSGRIDALRVKKPTGSEDELGPGRPARDGPGSPESRLWAAPSLRETQGFRRIGIGSGPLTFPRAQR
jgi:hypothetical protein